jgi:hypothetical protein
MVICAACQYGVDFLLLVCLYILVFGMYVCPDRQLTVLSDVHNVLLHHAVLMTAALKIYTAFAVVSSVTLS